MVGAVKPKGVEQMFVTSVNHGVRGSSWAGERWVPIIFSPDLLSTHWDSGLGFRCVLKGVQRFPRTYPLSVQRLCGGSWVDLVVLVPSFIWETAKTNYAGLYLGFRVLLSVRTRPSGQS